MMYGIKKQDENIILSNLASLVISLIYIYWYHALNSHWKRALPTFYLSAISIFVLKYFVSISLIGHVGAWLSIFQNFMVFEGIVSLF